MRNNLKKVGAGALLSLFAMIIVSYLYYVFTHLYIFTNDNVSGLEVVSMIPFLLLGLIVGVFIVMTCVYCIARGFVWAMETLFNYRF